MKSERINVNKAVENAFFGGHLGQDINLWLYGIVTVGRFVLFT